MRLKRYWMVHHVSRYQDMPIVLVKMKSPYQYDIATHQMFTDIKAEADAIAGARFVVYNFTDFVDDTGGLANWLTTQSRGARGSITDVTLQTMFVGPADQLEPLADTFRDEYGVAIGIYTDLEHAIDHAQNAARVFAAW